MRVLALSHGRTRHGSSGLLISRPFAEDERLRCRREVARGCPNFAYEAGSSLSHRIMNRIIRCCRFPDQNLACCFCVHGLFHSCAAQRTGSILVWPNKSRRRKHPDRSARSGRTQGEFDVQEHCYDRRRGGDFVAGIARISASRRRSNQRAVEVQQRSPHGERGSNPKFPTGPRGELHDYGILLFLGKGLGAEALRKEEPQVSALWEWPWPLLARQSC
jgi:hypothetical protein